MADLGSLSSASQLGRVVLRTYTSSCSKLKLRLGFNIFNIEKIIKYNFRLVGFDLKNN